MEHKKRFAVVIGILLAALLGTVGMSVAWMLETYRSLNDEFDKSVQEALDDAVALERKLSGATTLDISIPAAGRFRWGALEGISPAEIASISIRKGEEGGSDKISLALRADTLRTDAAKKDRAVNVRILRSFLDEQFRSRGIRGDYSLSVVRRPGQRFVMMQDADSAWVSSVRVAGAGGDTTLISYGPGRSQSDVQATPDTLYDDRRAVAHAREFRAEAGDGASAECLLRMEVPQRMLWGKLGGVVASAVLIALVLCFSFLYLLRTLLRMKSVEAMRRDFTHNITHELKTPIAAIGATNEALADFAVADDPARRKKYLDIQRHYLQTLSAMVERILSLSVQEREDFRLHPEPCSLREIIDEAARTLPLRYKKSLHIHTDLPVGDCLVRVDRFHFGNVLLNILDNAVKYGSAEPRIRIRAGRTADGGQVFVSVSDDGPGIPTAQRKRIFEKYYRIPTGDVHNVRGYGIGLYYCRLVVEKLGGRIRVDDNPGGGSVFTVVLSNKNSL